MPLALPLQGMAPLLLHVVFDPFELRHAPVERKVLVKALELRGEVSLLIASTPVSVPFQPCIRVIQEFPAALFCRNPDHREFPLGIDAANMLETQKLKASWLKAVRRRAFAREPAKENHSCLLRRYTEPKDLQTYLELTVEILGVPFVLKRHNKIVHKARQICLPLHIPTVSPSFIPGYIP